MTYAHGPAQPQPRLAGDYATLRVVIYPSMGVMSELNAPGGPTKGRVR
jgi:hypothetical protein